MTYLTVIVLYFSLGTVIYPFYGKFPIRMRMSPYSTYDVRLDLFTGFVSDMESRLQYHRITVNSPQNQLAHRTNSPHYQLAPANSPHLFYQLSQLLLPTRPMLFVNSPGSLTNSPQLLPTRLTSLTNSPRFSYQLAPCFCQLPPLLGPSRLRL